jgi:two-component system response regulator CpxR
MDGTKILLVEDDTFLRDLYVENLLTEGFSVTAVEDGAQGLDKIEQEAWDLILLDLMLPKMDGFEILRRAKESGAIAKSKKVVILTNNTLSNPEQAKDILELSSEYLIKSEMNPQQFIEKVKGFLAQSSQTVSSPTE